MAGQAYQAGRLSGRHKSWTPGDSGIDENTQQTAGYSGQCQPAPAGCHQRPEELVNDGTRLPKGNTNRLKNSFVLCAIKLHNTYHGDGQ